MASRAERSTSFGAVAGEYDRLRPPPWPQAVDWLLPARRQLVVDLGAGTGLLSRALAAKAGHVIAVEPDARMREVLQARSPGIEVRAGRGEQIPLPDASADGVFASSSWHWMDPDVAVPEILRVLRDGGRLGLIWTGRSSDADWLRPGEWFRDPSAAHPSDRPDGFDRHEIRLPDASKFRDIETATFRFNRVMSTEDVIAMLATYSGVITARPDVREAGRARAAAALAARFPGAREIEVPMRSRCFRADRVPRPG